jgi:hypothetical protein
MNFLGDIHKIITFYSSASFNCPALAIFSPRFTEILTDEGLLSDSVRVFTLEVIDLIFHLTGVAILPPARRA